MRIENTKIIYFRLPARTFNQARCRFCILEFGQPKSVPAIASLHHGPDSLSEISTPATGNSPRRLGTTSAKSVWLNQKIVCSLSHNRPTRPIDYSPNRRFRVRKLQSPKLSPTQFEPELVWTTRSVLDSAVDQIDAANRTPATKAKMAERILRAASDGITDPMKLTAIAIEDGTQAAD
jgi:hypothetical protein